MNLICISGKRESGKSLLASYLEHNHNFERFSLADALKKRVMADFNLRPAQLWGNEKESPTQYKRTDGSMYTGRDILIRMGTFYRSIDTLFWCKQFDSKIGDNIVIDDVRFKNEVAYFKQNYNAKFVRLERFQELCPHKRALDDLSEQDLDSFCDWDFKLLPECNKTPEDLRDFARYITERSALAF